MEILDENVTNQLNNIQREIAKREKEVRRLRDELNKRVLNNPAYLEALSQRDMRDIYEKPIQKSDYWGSEEKEINAKIVTIETQIDELRLEYGSIESRYEYGLIEQERDPVKALTKAKGMPFGIETKYLRKLGEDLEGRTDLTPEFLVDLVKADSRAIYYIPEKFINQEIILEAIKTDPNALVMAINENNDFENKAFIRKVIKVNPDALVSVNSDIETKLKDMGLLEEFVTRKTDNSVRMFIEAFKNDGSFANLSPKLLSAMLETGESGLRHYPDSLKQLVQQRITEKIDFYKENPEALKLAMEIQGDEPKEEQRENPKLKTQLETEQIKIRLTPYQVIARNALMNWNGLSEEEATKKVQESTFEELESQVYAEGSITYALEGLQIAAKKVQNKFRRFDGNSVDPEPVINDYRIEELKEIVLHGGKSKEEEDKIYAEIKESLMLDIPELWSAEDMTLTILSHIHDGWVRDNQKKFMARDKKYQHMPIELIGWKEAKADLLFLQPILSAMNVGYMESSLESAYDERVKEFFKTRGIKDISQLQEQISKGASFYPALKGQEDILQALQDPQFVAESVIPSIQEKGVGADENAMKRVEQWKTRSSKLATARARKKELQKEEKTIGEAEKLIEEKENNGQSLE